MLSTLPEPLRGLFGLLCLSLLMGTGCSSDAVAVGTWWGPLPEVASQVPFEGGRGFAVKGFATRFQTPSSPVSDLTWVALVGAEAPVSCAGYAAYLGQITDIQTTFEELDGLADDDPAKPSTAELFGYVCQGIQGASREAFGGDGKYRAVHLLLDTTDGGPGESGRFEPAQLGDDPETYAGAHLIAPSTYVARYYERSVHGDGLLPTAFNTGNAGDYNPLSSCPAILNRLLEGSENLPDKDVPVLNAAAHRYYHQYTNEPTLPFQLAQGGAPVDVPTGIVAENYDQLASSGGELGATLFLDVDGAVGSFPFEQVLLGTKTSFVGVEPCSELSEVIPIAWAELEELGWSALSEIDGSGDDDDSAAAP